MKSAKIVFISALLLLVIFLVSLKLLEYFYPPVHFYGGYMYARYVNKNQPAILETYGLVGDKYYLLTVKYRENTNSNQYDHTIVNNQLFGWKRVRLLDTASSESYYPPLEEFRASCLGKQPWYSEENLVEPSPIINKWMFDTPEYKEAVFCHSGWSTQKSVK